MLEQKDITIRGIVKEYVNKGNLLTKSEERFKGLQHDYDELQQKYDGLLNHRERLDRKNAELQRNCQDWSRLFREKETEYARHLGTMKLSYAKSYEELKQRGQRENYEKEILIRDLRGQLEQMKKECGMLQDQMSLYEQQHANEQSRGGSYLDDTKAATPALLVSALNGVKDASNNFVKVLRNSIQPGMDAAQFEDHIGAVSRNGHTKFQYQAYVCRILFEDFEHPYSGASNVVLPPTTYFRQYQNHDLKKTDTVDRLFTSDRDIDASLHEFCFNKFSNLMKDIQDQLTDRSIDLRKEVQNKKHPRGSKLYVSFCKLAVSVWLLQRLAFSFLHPAEQFTADRGAPFDPNRMQSVVPLDEPSSDEEVHLRVGFYVLPGFVVGNSAIPCEVYVALK
ncbi:hypothetical protein M758_11G016200 [Ceratodon purpureus]|nr:hypothetical protein M758_11G016200 [Ceratodon purpureus]